MHKHRRTTEQQLAMSTPMTAMATSKVIPTPLPFTAGKQMGLGLAQMATPQPQPYIAPTVQPKWNDATLKSQGDMAYMSTPGYSQYLSRVAKLTPEQILYPYQNTINPTTKQLYNINDVPAILKGMTDGKIGDKHRMAQSLLNQYGY